MSPTSIPVLPQEAFLSPSQQSTRRRSDGNRSGGTNDSNGKSSGSGGGGGGDVTVAPAIDININKNNDDKMVVLITAESPTQQLLQQQQQQQPWYQNPFALNSSVTPSVSPVERPLLWLESASTTIDIERSIPPGRTLRPSTSPTITTQQLTTADFPHLLIIDNAESDEPLTNNVNKGGVAIAVPQNSTEVDEVDLLERLLVVTQWDFDIFSFDARVGGRSLTFISHELFSRFELFSPLISSSRSTNASTSISQYRGPGVREDVFARFVTQLEREYCFNPSTPNPYHTSLHAADVVQAVGAFLVVPRLSSTLSQTDALCVLLAAMIHDFKHPGVSNSYLVKTDDPIAVRYNDESVLENFHSSEGFSLLHRDGVGGRFDVLGCLSDEARRAARFLIIKLVLATDLANGAKITSAFKSRLSMAHTMGETDDDKLLVMQQMIKCADVSHPARAIEMHERWSSLISEEFYKQGDLEKSIGLPISPLCDREAHNLAKSQIGFIEYVVKPAFVAFSSFCEVETWNTCLFDNLLHWKEVAARKQVIVEKQFQQQQQQLLQLQQNNQDDAVQSNSFEDIPKVDDSLDLDEEEESQEEREREGDTNSAMAVEENNNYLKIGNSNSSNSKGEATNRSSMAKTRSGLGLVKRVSWVKVNVDNKES